LVKKTKKPAGSNLQVFVAGAGEVRRLQNNPVNCFVADVPSKEYEPTGEV